MMKWQSFPVHGCEHEMFPFLPVHTWDETKEMCLCYCTIIFLTTVSSFHLYRYSVLAGRRQETGLGMKHNPRISPSLPQTPPAGSDKHRKPQTQRTLTWSMSSLVDMPCSHWRKVSLSSTPTWFEGQCLWHVYGVKIQLPREWEPEATPSPHANQLYVYIQNLVSLNWKLWVAVGNE